MRWLKMMLFLFILAVPLGPVGGVLSAAESSLISVEEAMSQFVSGGLAYKEGDYDRAIKEYEEILKGGRESGTLYYNLGNSYFRKKDYGRAILNYERARRLIPRDSDLNFNYYYALAQAGADRRRGELNFFRKMMASHVLFYTLDEMILISAGLSFLIAVVHLASLYLRGSRRIRRSILGALSVFLIFYLFGSVVKMESRRNSAVAVANSEAKFEPRDEATTYFSVKAGTKIKILKTQEAWAKIRREDGKMGWVPQKVFEYI